jgi:hypothetical protein
MYFCDVAMFEIELLVGSLFGGASASPASRSIEAVSGQATPHRLGLARPSLVSCLLFAAGRLLALLREAEAADGAALLAKHHGLYRSGESHLIC